MPLLKEEKKALSGNFGIVELKIPENSFFLVDRTLRQSDESWNTGHALRHEIYILWADPDLKDATSFAYVASLGENWNFSGMDNGEASGNISNALKQDGTSISCDEVPCILNCVLQRSCIRKAKTAIQCKNNVAVIVSLMCQSAS